MKTLRSLAAGAALLFIANAAQAQSASTSVALNVTQAATISITTSTTSLSINNVAAGTVTQFPTFNVTTAWNQPTASANVQLIGYFGGANALTGTSGNIEAARVVGAINGNPQVPFTGTFGGNDNAVQFFTQTLASAPNGGRNDAMNIGLNYTSGTTPTAGSYTGTLNLVLLIQ